MQRFFHDELRQLRDDLILMGERSLDMTRLVLRAVETGDDSLALQVRGMDDRVDELEKRVDREIMRYLTLFGPMGSDVRLLLAARDIGHDIERIADEASVIAKRAMVISERGPLKNLLHVPTEGIIACEVLRLALDSFIEGDIAKARLVLERDAEIDALNRRNYEELFGKAGDSTKVSASHVELIFISKALERIGDHSKNIAEQVIFLLSGEDVRHTR
ncbi:MAG: phosphate signaling complex protein PhoU [Verrucomicrobia bacterium]|jgi:phosphate transport system protein|nr:phosphate signaling complex protein PhoU [Verrucomicrobiota bacterium]